MASTAFPGIFAGNRPTPPPTTRRTAVGVAAAPAPEIPPAAVAPAAPGTMVSFGRITSPDDESLADASIRATRGTLAILAPAALPAPDGAFDAALVAILDAPALPGETIAAAFQRKERALGAAFATLDVLASRAMHARLANPRSDDDLAARFARLTGDRRGRLLAFLADARRRAATSRP